MPLFVLSSLVLIAGCGGASGAEGTLPDESGDLEVGRQPSSFSSEGTTPAGPDVGGTQWRWVEAHCTEGPLDLSSRGFSQTLRVEADAEGLLLVYDQVFAAEACAQTVVQRARPTENPRQWTIVEQARAAQPSTEGCLASMEEERPGEVRRHGQFLEVLVQRSMVWCNGLEVRMVYAPAQPEPLSTDEIVRHYIAHYNRRDDDRVASLFAESGSLVEPFHVTPTGGATRHDGRAAIQAWYREVLHSPVEWLALRLEGVEPTENGAVASWEYMDPRLEEPMGGRTHFTIAVGEIFEARFELIETPVEASADAEETAVDETAENEGDG